MMKKIGPRQRSFRPPLPPKGQLSPRQKTVVTLIADGYTSRQIAAKLGIAFKTVECHRGAAMERTGSGCVAHLVRYALRTGLIT